MFYYSCMWLIFTAITALSFEEVTQAHIQRCTSLFRSSTVIKSTQAKLSLLSFMDFSTWKIIPQVTVKWIPVRPGTPTSPLRPGIPGKFIVSPGSPVSSEKTNEWQGFNLNSISCCFEGVWQHPRQNSAIIIFLNIKKNKFKEEKQPLEQCPHYAPHVFIHVVWN